MMEYFTEIMDNIMERTTREISAIPTKNLTTAMKSIILGIIEGCIQDNFNQMLYGYLGQISEEDSIVEYFNPDTENDIC